MNSHQDDALEPTRTLQQTTVSDFCSLVNQYVQESEDPFSTATACEYQAEAVRITKRDVNPETLELLLDTLLNTLEYMGKQWRGNRGRKYWKNRVATLLSLQLPARRQMIASSHVSKKDLDSLRDVP